MSSLIAALDIGLGSVLFGYSIACIFYGVSTVQTFIYFRVSPRDGVFLKASILFVWILDTLHTAFLAACLYIVVVLDIANLATGGVNVNAQWTLAGAIYVTCVIELAVRTLFITRIWKLSKGNIPSTVTLSVLTVAVFATSIIWGVHIQELTGIWLVRNNPAITIAPFAIGLLTDVLMTGGQCYLLWRNRTGSASSNSIVRSLIVYILNTGVLVCLVTGAVLAAFAISNTVVYIGIYVTLPKIFFNALLTSLNVRELIFPASEPAPPRAPGRATKSELAVHVQTTTMHRVEAGRVIAPRRSRRWQPEKPAWIPMDVPAPAVLAYEYGAPRSDTLADTDGGCSDVWAPDAPDGLAETPADAPDVEARAI